MENAGRENLQRRQLPLARVAILSHQNKKREPYPGRQVRGEEFRHMHPVRGGVSVGRWSSIGAGYKAKLFFNPARYIQRFCCCSLVTVLTPSEVAICIVCAPRGLPSFDQYSYSSAVTTRNSNFTATKWTFFPPDTHFKHPSCKLDNKHTTLFRYATAYVVRCLCGSMVP